MGLVAREGSDTIFSADTMTTGVKQSQLHFVVGLKFDKNLAQKMFMSEKFWAQKNLLQRN